MKSGTNTVVLLFLLFHLVKRIKRTNLLVADIIVSMRLSFLSRYVRGQPFLQQKEEVEEAWKRQICSKHADLINIIIILILRIVLSLLLR